MRVNQTWNLQFPLTLSLHKQSNLSSSNAAQSILQTLLRHEPTEQQGHATRSIAWEPSQTGQICIVSCPRLPHLKHMLQMPFRLFWIRDKLPKKIMTGLHCLSRLALPLNTCVGPHSTMYQDGLFSRTHLGQGKMGSMCAVQCSPATWIGQTDAQIV